MKLPLDLRVLGMDPSPALEAAARERAERLDRFCTDITSCRVTVEALHKHQRQGHPFAVRIDVTRPGQELVVDRIEAEDAYVALRDAFDAMTRRLEESQRRTRVIEQAQPHPQGGR